MKMYQLYVTDMAPNGTRDAVITDGSEIIDSRAERTTTMSKKLTKKQQAERAAEDQRHEEELTAWEAWRDRDHGRVQQGVVRWFNKLSGEGMLRADEDGRSYAVYACNLPGRRTRYPQTACMYYREGQRVEFKLDISHGAVFVIGVTPAEFDAEKWARLDQEKLAFRCDEAGQLVSGLFK